MIRRNIDTSVGLVNGAICEVIAIHKNLLSEIERVDVNLNNTIHSIEKVTVNFEIYQGI